MRFNYQELLSTDTTSTYEPYWSN